VLAHEERQDRPERARQVIPVTAAATIAIQIQVRP
jgi:hypothetical protein